MLVKIDFYLTKSNNLKSLEGSVWANVRFGLCWFENCLYNWSNRTILNFQVRHSLILMKSIRNILKINNQWDIFQWNVFSGFHFLSISMDCFNFISKHSLFHFINLIQVISIPVCIHVCVWWKSSILYRHIYVNLSTCVYMNVCTSKIIFL